MADKLQSRVQGINVALRVGYPLKLDAEQCRLLADYLDSLEAERDVLLEAIRTAYFALKTLVPPDDVIGAIGELETALAPYEEDEDGR